MSHQSRCGLVLLACVLASAAGLADDTPPTQRDLWSRNDLRYERNWLVLGAIDAPLTADSIATAGGESALQPAAGATQLLAGGKSLTWQPASAWSDVFDFVWPAGATEYRGGSAAPQIAYAFHNFVRERDEDADLQFGSSGRVRIWLNGVAIADGASSRRFAFDEDRVRIHLHKGDNAVLIKSEHTSGPWTFSLRLVAPGTLTPRPPLAAAVSAASAGALTVSTDIHRDFAETPVDVSVVAAGGGVVAHKVVPRGRDAQFASGAWPDGPYEIRVQVAGPWQETRIQHLDWYKGDAKAAAERVLAAAKAAPAGVPGDSVRMLADLIRERVGGSLEGAVDDGWTRIHAALMEYEELRLDQSGKPGSVHPFGFVRLAYTDDVDGSTQFCRSYLPPDYAATRASPLVIFLHGYNPPNPKYVGWWSVADRHSDIADHRQVIYVEPHGRGNTQYVGIGERDVLHCLEEAKRRFNVDPDRVYLTGESMGGSGTWLIASHHPELFAAIAPTYGGWDYRVLKDSPFLNPRATRPLERVIQETQSSFVGAESLLNLPIYVHHGDQDSTVSVEFTRHAVRMLDRWGYDLRYTEVPGRGHEDLGLRDDIVGWLLTHRRNPAPRNVRVRAVDLHVASAYWVRVEASLVPLQVIEVDAEAVDPGVFRIDTKNVASLTIAPPPALRGSTTTARVVWNGVESSVAYSKDGRALIAAADAHPAAGDKTPETAGGLSDFFRTPFAIVIGTTSGDERMRRYCEIKGRTLAYLWTSWQHQTPRISHDNEVTADLERRYSLLLIGGAADNSVTSRLSSKLPLKVDSDSVTIDGRRFAAHDAFVQLIHPNPSAPARYVMVVAATSTDGMYFWNPSVFWAQVFGFPTQRVDWNIVDGRRVALEPGFGADRAWIASGVFDRRWHLTDTSTFEGDAALRNASPLRRAPGTPVVLSAAQLDAYAGQYAVHPGFVGVIARAGDGLTLTLPGSPAIPFDAESATDFAVRGTADPLRFERAPDGKVSGFVVDFDGGTIHATRVP